MSYNKALVDTIEAIEDTLTEIGDQLNMNMQGYPWDTLHESIRVFKKSTGMFNKESDSTPKKEKI